MRAKIYLTTTLPYVNADPHIGFALELVQADVTARHYDILGYDVFFNTGTDEHGTKIYRQALKAGEEPQAYVDRQADRFKKLKTTLNLWSGLNFIRTTDPAHIAAAEEFWRRVAGNGYIYKKNYKLKYCVGCELEKTESELVDGRCPFHVDQTPEIIAEENYFFKFSAFTERLLQLYESQPDFVVPDTRLNEIKAFVRRGLDDFSISRLKSKMPWGVSVPGDDAHTMYVWFDALVNYISAIGFPGDEKSFAKWWPVIQFAGKDNLRQQSAMWQAMLMAADLPPSKQIMIHGFVMSDGQKMSKSLGNVIDPFALVDEYGTDAVRYYLLRHISPFADSDFTLEKFKAVYNANLANGLGNLVSRVLTMSRAILDLKRGVLKTPPKDSPWNAEVIQHLKHYEFNKALDYIWGKISESDAYVQATQPFITIKTDPDKAKADIQKLVGDLWHIAHLLEPFLPATAEKIKAAICENKPPTPALFSRKT